MRPHSPQPTVPTFKNACFLVRRLQSEEAFIERREINYTHGELRIPF